MQKGAIIWWLMAAPNILGENKTKNKLDNNIPMLGPGEVCFLFFLLYDNKTILGNNYILTSNDLHPH